MCVSPTSSLELAEGETHIRDPPTRCRCGRICGVSIQEQVATSVDRDELRVSSLELFFDLVFVFILTQLSALLANSLSFATAGRVLLIFVVLFWMYGGYVYVNNQVPPR